MSIDFLGKIADLIRFRSQFSHQQQTALTMPEFTNIQALQRRSLDALSLLLHVAATGGRRMSVSVDGNYSSLSLSPYSRDVKSWVITFPSLDKPVPGLDRDSIWTGRSRNLGFVICCPVAEKSLSHCTEVACTLRKPRATTIVVGYTDSLSRRQSTKLLSHYPNCLWCSP